MTDKLSADPAAMIARAREVVALNVQALQQLEGSIDDSLAKAVDVILSRPGYVVVTGMGKSGHIGGKIAATLASTGTNAFFVHPAEMSHGDLGMLRKDVTVLAISNSGESRELRDPLIYCQREGIPVIGMSAMPDSVALRRNTTSKYIGTTMVSPICTPIDSDAAVVPIRITCSTGVPFSLDISSAMSAIPLPAP